MNVNIICVGKIKEKYINDGIAEFSKRMQAFGKLSVTELKEFGNDFEREISIKKKLKIFSPPLKRKKDLIFFLISAEKIFLLKRWHKKLKILE